MGNQRLRSGFKALLATVSSAHLTLKTVLVLAGLTMSLPTLAADDTNAPPPPPKRLIVKFKAPLAQEIENALPASLELDEPERHVRPALFQKVAATKLKPLYPSLVSEKKQQRVSERQLTDAVKRRFADRWRRGGVRLDTPAISGTYIVDLSNSSEVAIQAALVQLQSEPDVEFVEREQVAQAGFTPNDPYFASSGTWGQAYEDLYGLYRVQAATAWDTSTGQGVIVAVVDTGIDATHPDLAGNLWTNAGEIPGNGIDDDGNGYIDDVNGWDFVGASYQVPVPDNNPADAHGHGTHVAGTIAANGNNGVGVIGVAWGARVMAVRGLDNAGTGTDAQLAAAVLYAANNGADVINNSYGGSGFSQVLLDAMNYAHSLGVVLVVSAGNDNARVENIFPASYPNVITVSAYTAADGKAYFSNWGTKIDVAAPGEDILSLRATGTSRGPVVGSIYVRLSGTSMAAPHVSGLAALILAQQPSLSSEQVRQLIRVSADDVYLPGVDRYSGSGRINAATATTMADPLESKIQWPIDGQVFAGPVSFTGVAQGTNFASYVLEYGTGETPASWTPIAQGITPVNGGELGAFEPNLPDGRHTIRLRTYDTGGRLFADVLSINVRYAAITSPFTPPVPGAAQTFKPGVVVPLYGNARGPSFVQYRVEWARGRNPSSGWTTSGITLVNGGAVPITNNLFATFDTSSITQADYYTIRMLVDNAGFTTDARTMINLEPALLSTNWPQWMMSGPAAWSGLWGGFVPVRDGAGELRLFLLEGPQVSDPSHSVLAGFGADGSTLELALDLNASFQPAAANMDGNPGDEIIVGDGGLVRVIRPDLSSYTFTPAQSVNFRDSRVVVDDLNNDGSPEIFLVGNAGALGYLYAWQTNGQLLTPNFPIQLTNGNSFQRDYSPVRFLTVDLNNDGLKEILVMESTVFSNCVVRAFQWDGTPYPWPQLPLANHVVEMTAGDMDGDGEVDIAFACLNNYSQESFLVVNAAGVTKPGWPITTSPVLSSGSRLAMADLDGDGKCELIASSIHKLFAWKADGSPLSAAWPVACENTENISIADVDGDGYPEVLASRLQWTGAWDEYKLVAVRRDGVQIRAWRFTGQFGYGINRGAALCPGDFDEDGVLDFGAWYAVGGIYGMATAISANTPYNPATIPWRLNFRDPQNTSVAAPPRSGAPSVRITSPTGGATMADTAMLTAEASDDLGVVGVQFQLDNTDLGAELMAPPYAMAWDTRTAANGRHSLKAIARDADGHITAAGIAIVLNNDVSPPTVSFTTPSPGAIVANLISIAATAADDFGVVGVQFQIDGANFGAEMLVPPYQATWDTRLSGDGAHTLSAIARDAVGHTTTTNITVTVNNDPTAPTVSITSPANNSRKAGIITVNATATDNVGVVGVQFKLNGTNLGGEDLISPYSISWDTTGALIGSNTLTAVARDAAGNSRTSAVVSVIVTNTVKINFQPAAAPTYAGYLIDAGEVYGNRGNGYSYGWNANNSANAFDRNSASSQDQRYDTLITMQTGGTFTWEIGVPNGKYSVHVLAGDADFFNSVYKINAENVQTVNATPKSNDRWKEGTKTVTVSDGRLTVSNATGASNNKLCFVELMPVP